MKRSTLKITRYIYGIISIEFIPQFTTNADKALNAMVFTLQYPA